MATRIVTFLGLGNARRFPETLYAPVTYTSPSGQTYGPTPMHDVPAIAEAKGPVHLVTLGTADVAAAWFGEEARFATLLRRDLPDSVPTPTIEAIEIPQGGTDAERWQVFEQLLDCLEDTPRAGETTAPETIVIDITHGFRSAPFFAASALAYAQAVRMRSDRAAPELRVLYASLPWGSDAAEIQDYTLILQALAWNNALTGLMRYGRADELERLLRERQALIMRGPDRPKTPPPFLRFAGAAKAFADALSTSRATTMVTHTAASLRDAVAQARPVLSAELPPIGRALDRLVDHLDGLSAERVISREGVRASLALVRQSIAFERFTEAVGLLREVVIDVWTCDQLPTDRILQPGRGDKAFREQRRVLEHRLGAIRHEASASAAIPSVYDAIAELRNDVQHCAYNPSPSKAASIRKGLVRRLEQLEAILADRVFINLSNHPSSGGRVPWTAAQVEASEALGCGSVVDVPFPAVDPHATFDDIETLARETVTDLLKSRSVSAAFVAGEPTLAFTLVGLLEAAGVACYAATTERTAVETQLEDGSVQKSSIFRFVKWRRYPQRSGA